MITTIIVEKCSHIVKNESSKQIGGREEMCCTVEVDEAKVGLTSLSLL